MSSRRNSAGLDAMRSQLSHIQAQLKDSPGGDSSGSSSSNKSFNAQRGRPFACPLPDCGRHFQRKFTLNEHLKTHTGAKPFQCQVQWCRKRFKTSGNMSRHRRLHTLKQFQCPAKDCLRIFTRQEKLALHYRVHLGSGAFPCNVPGCSKAFSTTGNLTRHMRRHHPSIPSPESPSAGTTVTPSELFVGPHASHFLRTEVHESSEFAVGGYLLQPEVAPARAPLETVSDQELVELLQCLFEGEPSEVSTPWPVNVGASPPQVDRKSHHFEAHYF